MKKKDIPEMSNERKQTDAFTQFMGGVSPAASEMATDTVDAAEPSESISPPFAIENIIKDYRIIRTVSETTSSIVYKAEDIRTKRRVAIKVIYNRDMPDVDRITRARVEIERLRHLSHPGIASLLDAGLTDEGHCYFVSEFIKGVTLNEYLAIHKLGLDDRLSIFARLCEAVHYAHQKCLLHRDLRPSNIIIDGKCNPKIVGFGPSAVTDVDIGPAREGTGKRELREFQAYKSPEQVAGRLFDIDVRSDVYSLGVIFYELLTDRLPYNCDSESGREIVQAVTSEMPPKPGTIKSQVRGDLEAIVLKTLEKQPADRYQTVSALSHDLENYFDQRPVAARRAGAMYEFRKLATRYKSRTISVMITTLAVLAFGVHIHATTREAGNIRVREIEQQMQNEIVQAQTARDIALEQRKAALISMEEAIKQREQMAGQMSQTQNQMATIDEVRSRLTARAEQAEAQARAADQVAGFWTSALGGAAMDSDTWSTMSGVLNQLVKKAAHDLADEPVVRAALMSDIGSIFFEKGDPERAIALTNDALKLQAAEFGDQHNDTIETLNTLASALFAAGKPGEAEPVCRRLVDATTATHGESSPRTLTAVNNLAMTLYSQKKYDEAVTLLEKALEGRAKVLGENDRRTASTAQNLGMVLFDAGRAKDAAVAFERALAVYQAKLPSDHWQIFDVKSRMGACMTIQKQFDNAEPLLLDAYRGLKASFGADHPETWMAASRVFALYEAWNQPEKADAFRKESSVEQSSETPAMPQ